MGNPICEINLYTERVFEALPGIDILDGLDREGREVMTDEEEANEENDLDDYGDEQDMVADGIITEKQSRNNKKIVDGKAPTGESDEDSGSEEQEDNNKGGDCSGPETGSEDEGAVSADDQESDSSSASSS